MYIFVFFEYSKSMATPSGVVKHPIVSSAAVKVMAARMHGKVALVTGAGSGIGWATARRLAAEGARVACVDRVADRAREVARAITAAGGEALALEADVTDPAACERMVDETVARFGRLTTLVNSAGVRPERMDRAPAPGEWDRVVDTNLTGTYLASRAALPALASSGHGAVTNLASIYGLVGGSLSPAYAASKGAVVNLSRQMAVQWAPKVRVNCVCPGVIETPMTRALLDDPAWREAILMKYPLQRFGQPDEVAAAILYLSSDEAGFVTGIALPVDGGYTAG
jgi:NAD(P)-dependent dehydrogenase (short-subunit alcohol dehydrogenase family)